MSASKGLDISKEVTPKRSWNMSRIRAQDTKPELLVRRLLHTLGYRYRLHAPELPGKPDIVFRPQKKAVFVHGCFWHRHEGCKNATMPKTRTQFWKEKFSKNVQRDKRVLQDLENIEWSSLIVWECEIKNIDLLTDKLREFLKP